MENSGGEGMDSTPAQDVARLPFLVRAARELFVLNAAIWIFFGAINLLRLVTGAPDDAITVLLITVLMFGNAAVMLIVSWGIGNRQRRYYRLALLVLAANLILGLIDEPGLFDLVTFVVDLALLAALIASRSKYNLVR